MTLPFLKKNPSPITDRKYLFALEISPGIIKSAIWSVINDSTQVLAVSSAFPWDDKTSESLISACDQAVTDATSHLDPSGKIQPNQVIFGLPSHWVEGEKITSDKLHFLKELSTKLELKPVGFVVTTEAIVKFLAHNENVPSSAILLGFWPQVLEVVLVRMGKIDGIHLVKKSSHLADDVVEGLSRFPNVDVLPSRMLLYDSGLDLEEIKQLLLQYSWQAPQKKLSFLHFPKVEILPPDFTVRAIALAGGTEVAQAIGLISETPQAEATPSDLGFVSDVDIQDQPPAPTVSPLPVPTAFTPPPKRFRLPHVSFPRISLPRVNLKFTAVIIITAVLISFASLFALYWYLPKSTVTLFVQPKNLKSQFSLTVDTQASYPDSTKLIIPGKFIEVTVSSDKTLPTTGSKIIGDKAIGSVTISNVLDSPKALPTGTVLTSPSGLKFVLDENVTIASASGSAGNLTPGKATVKITAGSIGSDYNLSGGTVFRVANFAITQIDAKNDAAISGGTSRQAKAVSKDDTAKLRADLTAAAKDQASQKLVGQISSDQTIIAESIVLQTISEDFNHKTDEAADELTLKLAVKTRAIAVSKSDLQSITEAQTSPQVPSGYSSISQSSQSFTVKKVDKDIVQLEVNVSASLLPNLDKDAIIKNISGKYPSQAKSYLETLPGISQIDILISPRLPASIAVISRIPKNISLNIQPSP